MEPLIQRFWAEIDLDAARENYLKIRNSVKEGTLLCCVVKANAYGHGAIALAQLYEELGADWLAVSNIEEGIQLRRAGITLPILLLGYTPAECAPLVAAYSLTQTVFSYEYAKMLDHKARESGVKLSVHIKLDTGMGRIGFCCKRSYEAKKAIDEIEQTVALPSLSVKGIFTHFAVSDHGDAGREYTLSQYERFCDAVEKLEERGVSFEIRHCANSAAILDYPSLDLDMVRAGIILYGARPSGELVSNVRTLPVMSLKAVISYVKDIDEGDRISYGCTFRADRKMRIATVPCGYGDGYLRSNGEENMYVLVRGQRANIVGRVCMDQLMIDVTDIDGASVGDTVTLMGRDGAEEITAEMLSERNGTIAYELFCQVGARVPRVYYHNGEVCRIVDNIVPSM